jgi:hypothetical protein
MRAGSPDIELYGDWTIGCLRPAVRQQFTELFDRMVGDAAESIAGPMEQHLLRTGDIRAESNERPADLSGQLNLLAQNSD